MKEKDSPGCSVSESQVSSFAVVVCGTESLFTQVTVVPGVTVISGGLKAKFWMLTVTSWPCCAPAAGTKISRAITERVTRYDSFLIDSSLHQVLATLPQPVIRTIC